MQLHLERAAGRLSDGTRIFDPSNRSWTDTDTPVAGEPVDAVTAATWLQRESGRPCRVPVGVLGTREATGEQLAMAEAVGGLLAEMGLTVICGGREGVMEATCRGVAGRGGTAVGLLPEGDPAAANVHVTIPIATGLGVARNAVIARAALCAVAVGGGYGTMSEIAFCLQFGTPAFGLAGAPELPGVQHLPGPDGAAEAVARVVLGLSSADADG